MKIGGEKSQKEKSQSLIYFNMNNLLVIFFNSLFLTLKFKI